MVRPVVATLCVAALGGFLAWLAGLPLAWLTGSMSAVAVCAVAGAPVQVPASWRLPVFVVLGISMGSGVTPQALESASAWPVSLLLLALAVPAMMIVSVVVISRAPGWDKKSALLASTPGALSYVLAVAADTGADVRRVAIVQTIRLVVLVLVLPPVIIAIGGTGVPDLPAVHEIRWLDLGLLACACGAAALACQRFNVPAGMLFGPMLVSALAHGAGWTDARLPPEILNLGLLVLGGLIGARFAGVTWTMLRSSLGVGLLNLILAMAVAALFAGIVVAVTGLPFGQILLAFAPGGAEAMAVMAFALDLDPAFVAVHHVARFLGLGLILPLVMRFGGTTAHR